jgi:hypothetical protein
MHLAGVAQCFLLASSLWILHYHCPELYIYKSSYWYTNTNSLFFAILGSSLFLSCFALQWHHGLGPITATVTQAHIQQFNMRVKVIKWFSSVLRIEVSRHFKVIRVLGPWDVPTRMSQRWVTKKEWSATSNIALGQMQAMHKFKWWTKNISGCRWISVYRLILH